MNAIDFFCGGGGMTKGLIEAGINVVFGLDSNPLCRETYEKNNNSSYYESDILEVSANQLLEKFPVLKKKEDLLMVGCAPCQPFSVLNPNNPKEHRSVNLLNEFGRIAKALHPAHILIENVPGLKGRGGQVLQDFVNMLEAEGYKYDFSIVNAKDYGVPQNRRRFILIASRIFVPSIPPATHGEGLIPYRTVFDAISKYPKLKAGETHLTVPNHRVAGLSKKNLERLLATPSNGGSRTDWPKELWLDCHKSFAGHTDVYGRMSWNSVSPTLTVKCFSVSNGRFAHPEQNRAISLREAASLQSFPDDYIFYGNLQEIGKQIGNAVPVLLAQKMGEYILNEHERQHKLD